MNAHCLSILAVALALAFSSSTPAGEEGTDHERITLADITKAWKQRQDRVRSAKFVWSERITHTKGSIMGPDDPGNKKRFTIPPEDVTYQSSYVVRFDGDKMSYGYQGGRRWRDDNGVFTSQDYTSVFDGKESMVYVPTGSDPIPKGIIWPQMSCRDAANINARPVMMVYRALDPAIGLPKSDEYVVSPESGVVNGRTCVVLQEKGGPRKYWLTQLWVDPGEEYVVKRYVLVGQAGQVSRRIDVRYTRDPRHGLVPAAWDGVWLMPDGSLRESRAATVTEYALNDAGKVGEIAFEFPPGTWVMDERTKTQYITRADSEKRMITEAERKATYQQLLNSESGEALNPPRKFPWWGWAIAVTVGIAVATLGFFLWRRSRSVKASPSV